MADSNDPNGKYIMFFPHTIKVCGQFEGKESEVEELDIPAKPVRMRGRPIGFRSDEGLFLGNGYTLLYSMNHYGTSNESLRKFGGIVSNIPGDAILTKEGKNGTVDVPVNILDIFPKILQDDMKKREEFEKEMMNMGARIF